jgi:DNA topoisomerase-6 subunit B
VLSRVPSEPLATDLQVSINTAKNRPEMHRKKKVPWDRAHGTRVEAQIHGHYHKGRHSIGMYLKQTVIVNAHVTMHFRGPYGERWDHERTSTTLPPRPVNVKPHPRGVELGQLIQMLRNTESHTLLQFLEHDFSRVGRKTAGRIIQQAHHTLTERSSPKRIAHQQSQALYRALQRVPVAAPRADCIVPIGVQQLTEGLHKEVDATFYTVTTRPPAVYRGNPYQIEVGLAYGQAAGTHLELDAHGHIHKTTRQRQHATPALAPRADEPASLLRFANRVPLLYDQEGCAITKAVLQTHWHAYGLEHAQGALPHAPLVILVHMASVWVPYTSEAKEAIAPYPEIVKEIRLGLQGCGRRLAAHLHQETRVRDEFEKRTRIEQYLPHVGLALQQILALSDEERARLIDRLDDILQEKRSL